MTLYLEESVLSDNQLQILDQPIFVIGSPRSGTTWLQRLLVSVPQITGGHESHFFTTFGPAWRDFKNALKYSRAGGLSNYLSAEEFRNELLSLWRHTMQSMLQAKPGAEVLAEKTPSHALFMPEILQILPRARFVHIIRDSRAVVASMLAAGESWGKEWAPRNARHAAIEWYRHTRTAIDVGRKLPRDQYMEIFYEDLRQDTHRQLGKVMEFVGVDVSAGDLQRIIDEQSFEEQKKKGGTPLATEQNTGLHRKLPDGFFRKGQTDSWKSDLGLLQKLTVWRYTRKLMGELGYTWSGERKP